MTPKDRDNVYNKHVSQQLYKTIRLIQRSTTVIVAMVLLSLIYIPYRSTIHKAFEPQIRLEAGTANVSSKPAVANGIHLETGLVYDKDFELVKGACTSCHSAQLITQNRATKEGWQDMIVWMQKTQGLPDLGKAEATIVEYLTRNYAPEAVGRRAPLALSDEDWYTLDL